MSISRSTLGVWQFSDTEIPASHPFITDEYHDNQRVVWAEHPSCTEVVHPE